MVDGRMTEQAPDLDRSSASLVIGLRHGFVAGENCHAVVETRRGPFLGRVIWQGSARPDTALLELSLSVPGWTRPRTRPMAS